MPAQRLARVVPVLEAAFDAGRAYTIEVMEPCAVLLAVNRALTIQSEKVLPAALIALEPKPLFGVNVQ